MSLPTRQFLDLLAASGLDRRLPEREPAIAAAMGATLDELRAWLHGAPMSTDRLDAFERALPALTADLPAAPAAG